MLVVPFDKVYAVASGIGKIRDVTAAKRLKLVSSDLAVKASTCRECSLKHLIEVADYEIEVDRCPVATEVTVDTAVRSSVEPVNPEGLSV